MIAGIKKKLLGQQPPRAKAHRCTTATTTNAHALCAEILATHNLAYSKLSGARRQQTYVTLG
jgi:hypothetical protein